MAEAHGTASVAVSNAALIDLGDRTVVVDTFMTARAAEELASESLRLTGRAPFLVLNTHWHSDHIGGNRVFRDAGIVGTSVMRDLIAGDAPSSRAEFEEAAAEIRNFAAEVASSARSDEDQSKAAGLRGTRRRPDSGRKRASCRAAQRADWRPPRPRWASGAPRFSDLAGAILRVTCFSISPTTTL